MATNDTMIAGRDNIQGQKKDTNMGFLNRVTNTISTYTGEDGFIVVIIVVAILIFSYLVIKLSHNENNRNANNNGHERYCEDHNEKRQKWPLQSTVANVATAVLSNCRRSPRSTTSTTSTSSSTMTSYYTASPLVRIENHIPKGQGCGMVPCIPEQNPCRTTKLCHARNYYNPARNCVYSRFSACDWGQNNVVNFCVSNQERNISELLRTDAWRAVGATDKLTRLRQGSNTRKLGERVKDIAWWKEELLKEINAMDTETENLNEHKRILEKALHDSKLALAIAEECIIQREKRTGIEQVHDEAEKGLCREHKRILEKALHDSKLALAIAEECIIQREKRTGIEQVHDEAEKGLCREVLLIRKCQERMKRMIEKANVQLKMNRCVRHQCDIDVRDKHHAQGIDDRMHQLRNCSFGIGYHPGVESIDNTVSDTVSWVKFTQENIERSRKEREISDIDLCLRQCANDMWSQFTYINAALERRVKETVIAKEKLEAHIQRINIEIRDLERAIELLRCAIMEKEAPLKVAQTRLDERTRRICVEVCNDQPMKGLQTEVYELRQSIATLKEKLRCAELGLCRLLKVRSRLEADIVTKENSIQIDSRCCLAMRKNVPLDPKIGPLFTMTACAKANSMCHNVTCDPVGNPMSGGSCPPCASTYTGTTCCY